MRARSLTVALTGAQIIEVLYGRRINDVAGAVTQRAAPVGGGISQSMREYVPVKPSGEWRMATAGRRR